MSMARIVLKTKLIVEERDKQVFENKLNEEISKIDFNNFIDVKFFVSEGFHALILYRTRT